MRMTSKTISFITTVLNEEMTIEKLLSSVLNQTQLPDEIIITDGGSQDKTVEKITRFFSQHKEKLRGTRTELLKKPGNRSVGRNEAIKKATGDIIVCTDSGCIVEKHWIEEITKPFSDAKTDVVAGFYNGKAENVFQKSLIPYVLVMPDRVNTSTFLPASRSMAFRKTIWEKVGGFPEKYSHNEDYVFAHSLRKIGAKITFAKDAIVYWMPRNSFAEAYIMFRRFAYGDVEAGMWRKKVLAVFIRYIVGMFLLLYGLLTGNAIFLLCLLVGLLLYMAWAVSKNYRYVKQIGALFYLPMLQFTADFAVLSGSLAAIINSWATPHTR